MEGYCKSGEICSIYCGFKEEFFSELSYHENIWGCHLVTSDLG